MGVLCFFADFLGKGYWGGWIGRGGGEGEGKKLWELEEKEGEELCELLLGSGFEEIWEDNEGVKGWGGIWSDVVVWVKKIELISEKAVGKCEEVNCE